MSDIELQIEQIESARKELKKHFGEFYELGALIHTIPLLEELKVLREKVKDDKLYKQGRDAIDEYKRKVSADMWSRYKSRKKIQEFDDEELQIMQMMLKELDKTLNYEHKNLER